MTEDHLPSGSVRADESQRRRDAQLPALGARGWLRFLWRQLTSMQTALLLLLLLAVAALPGSLYPQRNVDPGAVTAFLEENGTYGEILDALGFFNVFSSPWFSAIYLLLFVSLIGCIVPRVAAHWRQLRSAPPRTPVRLTRFAGHTEAVLPDERPRDVLARAENLLRRGRYRTVRADGSTAGRAAERADESTAKGTGGSVSAERGYLRETGNLVFHVALVGVLVGVALGHQGQYRGQVTVVEGEGFANSLSRYDSFESGPWFDPADLPDFQFTLDDFEVSYETRPGPQLGEPRSYEAHLTVREPGEGEREEVVQVNEPLQVGDANAYLLGNGYAPVLTLTDSTGAPVAGGAVIALPQDGNMTSTIVVKAPDARPEQLAVVGLFMPTAQIDETGPHSRFPDLWDPAIALSVYEGDLGLDDGVPRNVYEIDVSTLDPVTQDDGTMFNALLRPGESIELPGGRGTLAFEDVRRFAAFDIERTPFLGLTLVSSLAALGGLILSLFVPRRRVWVRAVPAGDGTRIEVAGLARSEDFALERDVRAIARELGADVPEDDVPADDVPEDDVPEDDEPADDLPGDQHDHDEHERVPPGVAEATPAR